MSSSNKIIIGVISFTMLAIIGGTVFLSKTGPAQLETAQNVQLELPITSHDWGEIDINAGNVTKTFEIKNNGSDTLELANVSTSCMCTTAQVTVNDQPSPFFGMHSASSWQGKVNPGESANVYIEFDPLFHGPNGVGQITRQVSVETNDPDNPIITFNLTGNVIK